MSRPEPLRPTRLAAREERSAAAEPAAGPRRVTAKAAGHDRALAGRALTSLLRIMRSRVVRIAFLAAVLALLAVALVDQGDTLWHEVRRLSAPVVLLAFALNLCGLVCSLMVWREMLADLGSRLSIAEAWRIMYVGQLAKYIPGSIWPVLAQSELGADRGIPRSRSALSVILCYAVMTSSGAVVAAITLPFASAGSVAQYFWILFLIPIGLAVLSPPVLNRLLRLVLRLARQPAENASVSYKGLARTMTWAMAGWAANGLVVYVLLRHLAGHPQGTLLVSIGAYSLSWSVGLLSPTPAGAGAREAVMIAVLHTQTTAGIALAVALVSRAISVVCDALTGAAASALVGRRRLRQLRAERRLKGPGRSRLPT